MRRVDKVHSLQSSVLRQRLIDNCYFLMGEERQTGIEKNLKPRTEYQFNLNIDLLTNNLITIF